MGGDKANIYPNRCRTKGNRDGTGPGTAKPVVVRMFGPRRASKVRHKADVGCNIKRWNGTLI